MSSPFSKCKGEVVVVGNGPISESDRQQINNAECVFRFNDTKNYIEGDKIDYHVIRRNGLHMTGEEMHPGVEKIAISYNSRHIENFEKQILTFESKRKTNSLDEHRLFPVCDCEDRCNASNSIAGASSGAALINELEGNKSIKKIHVFGMNWNGSDTHIDFKYPDIIPTCCTKCDIHTTSRASYL